MKLQSSLFAKIVLWFFLNLILLITILGLLFTVQSQFDIHNVLGRDTNDRVRATGRQIMYEINQVQQSKWNDILARHAQNEGVDFALFFADESIFFSKALEVPDEVLEMVRKAVRLNPPFAPKNDDYRLPPRHDRDRRGNDKRREPRLYIRTKSPALYWTGVKLRIPQTNDHTNKPIILLAVSDSVTGNGYFFDPIPWIVVAVTIIAFSALLWIPFVRHITSPLKAIALASEEIAKGKFGIKVKENRLDEIGRLGKAINHMTSHLEGYVTGQKRFLRDIAHELGSPIARINFGLGSLEQRIDPENQDRLNGIIEDVAHLSNLVNEILSFTKAEMNPEKVELSAVTLLPLIQRAIRSECDKNHHVQVDVDSDITVVADPELLTRAMANLIRNALNYAGTKKPIHISANRIKNKINIVFQDQGPGVPEHLIRNLFEPFYRPEKSRSKASGGVGLGLAIVKTCIETCNGSVLAENVKPNGFVVRLTLDS
jgi:two-component system, OmpR family, sensor histidine kinase CpxA